MDLDSLLRQCATNKGIRQSTLFSYKRLLTSIGIIDDSLCLEDIQDRLFTLDNVNTRRATTVAVRSVLGYKIRIPKGSPKIYDLPSEDTLRLALTTSKYESRGLLMMYAGLRVGEACAITAKMRTGDRLRVDRQVVELHTGSFKTNDYQHIIRVGPVKTQERNIVIPNLLIPIIDSLTDFDVPSRVRTAMHNAGKRVGIQLNPHQLRHWYCTESLKRGIPVVQVSRQMGHCDVAVTLRTYQQTNDEAIHDVWG